MRLEYTARAVREIESALTWWRENRPDAPTMLADELDEVLERLTLSPNLGELWAKRRGREIRKILLPRTKKKIYITPSTDSPDVLIILCLWGGQRGREPAL